jgi:hypothetical protein
MFIGSAAEGSAGPRSKTKELQEEIQVDKR